MKKVIFIIVLTVAAGLFFFTNLFEKQKELADITHEETSQKEVSDQTSHDRHDHKDSENSLDKNKRSKTESSKEANSKKTDSSQRKEYVPKDEAEKSFLEVQKEVKKLVYSSHSDHQFVEFLKTHELEPEVSEDANEATGVMKMVRAKKGLSGTRYYHAQFISDEGKVFRLQHMSMELRPGPDALQNARKMLEDTYGVYDPKIRREGDYISYQLEDCRLLWAKRMTAEDLQGDFYNAYDPQKDIGTIRVVVEDDIHCGHEGHGH